MTTAESLLKEAMQLSSDERELLAIELFASLEKEPGYDEAWEAEIERRIADLESGRTRPIELDDSLDIFGPDQDE
jgi:putative addiction module component (TIGR02574 family)